MAARKSFLPALAITAVVFAGLGFGATHLWDQRALHRIESERDAARDCRRSGATVAPCPVIYRNTRIVWRDRVRTIQTRDPKQAARIAVLSARLTHARRTIVTLERRRTRERVAAVSGWQNGTRQYPYNTAERCPAGSVVAYDAGLTATGIGHRYSGDPDVCYVLTKRLALYSPRG